MNDRVLDFPKQASPKKQDNSGDENSGNRENEDKNKGELIVDAIAFPQDIAYPTDLNEVWQAIE